MELEGYKLYTFVNTTYMRPIQFGIQTAHLLGAMVLKYIINEQGVPDPKDYVSGMRVRKYLEHPEPFIEVRDGRYLQHMVELRDQLSSVGAALNLPTATFFESNAALGGIMTCVGIIAPTSYTDTDRYFSGGIVNVEWKEDFDTPLEVLLADSSAMANKAALYKILASHGRAR